MNEEARIQMYTLASEPMLAPDLRTLEPGALGATPHCPLQPSALGGGPDNISQSPIDRGGNRPAQGRQPWGTRLCEPRASAPAPALPTSQPLPQPTGPSPTLWRQPGQGEMRQGTRASPFRKESSRDPEREVMRPEAEKSPFPIHLEPDSAEMDFLLSALVNTLQSH